MVDVRSKIHEIYTLEQLSSGRSVIHDLHPSVKILATFFYIVLVLSFDRHTFFALTPFIFYPVLLMSLSETPYAMILKRVVIALPFSLFAGLSNVFFDQATMFTISGLNFSYGFVSLIVLLFRTFLCVAAVLILVAVTPFTQITAQMRRMHIPDLLVTLFEMTYRYLGSLAEETSVMIIAYKLRHNSDKGIELKDMGSFVGQLLLKSIDRAEHVYNAMKCRGYGRYDRKRRKRSLKFNDYLFILLAIGFPLFFRFIDLNQLFQPWIMKVTLC